MKKGGRRAAGGGGRRAAFVNRRVELRDAMPVTRNLNFWLVAETGLGRAASGHVKRLVWTLPVPPASARREAKPARRAEGVVVPSADLERAPPRLRALSRFSSTVCFVPSFVPCNSFCPIRLPPPCSPPCATPPCARPGHSSAMRIPAHCPSTLHSPACSPHSPSSSKETESSASPRWLPSPQRRSLAAQ